MIAISRPPVCAEPEHEQFLVMLPLINRLAKQAFRNQHTERRNDLVQEVVAKSFVAYARLVELGKQSIAYATPLANFAIRQVLGGRRAGCRQRRNDVMSDCPTAPRTLQLAAIIDDESGELREVLCEDHRAGPAETAAARIDITNWLQSLPRRNRQIARALGNGESTQDVASRFRVSPARVSQLRREFERSWCVRQGELPGC